MSLDHRLEKIESSMPVGRPSKNVGLSLTWGLLFTYVGLLVLLPVGSLFWQAAKRPFSDLWELIVSPVAIAAYQLTFGSAIAAATINSVFGLILAWILVRYSFPGKRLADGLVDLPFAMPGVVAGITLVTMFAPGGTIGQFFESGTPFGMLLKAVGIQEANLTSSVFGVVLAQVFSTLPFVVRTVQPVLVELEPEVEEVAYTLGANPWQTFWRVIFPQLLPAILAGFALALARAIGEFGIILIISSNIPYETLVSTVYIYQRLEEFDYSGATAVAIVVLAISLGLLTLTNLLQYRSRGYEQQR